MNLNSINKDQLIDLFNHRFLNSFNTCLKGGSDEPLYLPQTQETPAEIHFRADYVSSALHEIAHWCIAGKERRQQEDYGYWYEPDGRSSAQQQEFEQVEVKPQALEWIFSIAAGIKFHISADNLSVDASSNVFTSAVIDQAKLYLERGLPKRAAMFYEAISENTSYGRQARMDDFSERSLI